MKNPLIALLLAGGSAFGGTTSKEVIQTEPAETGVWSWFAGASIGYLYLDDTRVAGAPASGIAHFEDDFLGELGLRFNF